MTGGFGKYCVARCTSLATASRNSSLISCKGLVQARQDAAACARRELDARVASLEPGCRN
jgi:hypothetical protein